MIIANRRPNALFLYAQLITLILYDLSVDITQVKGDQKQSFNTSEKTLNQMEYFKRNGKW